MRSDAIWPLIGFFALHICAVSKFDSVAVEQHTRSRSIRLRIPDSRRRLRRLGLVADNRSIRIRSNCLCHPTPVGADARVDAVLELARAAPAERDDPDQDWPVGCVPNQRSTTVPLAGIDPALAVTRAHHSGVDGATV